jgi:phage pi2 protein 07
MKNLLKHISYLFQDNHNPNLEQLEWQRYLLHNGIPATAKVLDMVLEKSEIQEYSLIHIWIMMKVSEQISFRHVQTLMNKKDIPAVGQMINIRYSPDDMSKVIII